jgi:hypothetical protein
MTRHPFDVALELIRKGRAFSLAELQIASDFFHAGWNARNETIELDLAYIGIMSMAVIVWNADHRIADTVENYFIILLTRFCEFGNLWSWRQR